MIQPIIVPPNTFSGIVGPMGPVSSLLMLFLVSFALSLGIAYTFYSFLWLLGIPENIRTALSAIVGFILPFIFIFNL